VSLLDDNHVVLNEDGTASEKPSSEYDYATAYANVVDITYLVRIHYERQMFFLIKVSHSLSQISVFQSSAPLPIYISFLCIPV
jgi:hypothetical protein